MGEVSQDEKSGAQKKTPRTRRKKLPTPPQTSDEVEGRAREPAAEYHSRAKPSGTLLQRLTLNEWLTLLVGLGTLGVSILAWRTASDTSDLKSAVDGLTKLSGQTAVLAGETKRQADASAGQLITLNSQLEESQKQTRAISDQADATKRSADAAVRAAEASIKAAEALRRTADTTEKAMKPLVSLGELHVGGFQATANDQGLVPITASWRFNNTGGGSFVSKQVEWGLAIGESLPAEMPKGVVTSGNDYRIVNSIVSGLNNSDNPATFYFDKKTVDAVNKGAARVFFFARFDYDDGVTGEPRTTCFGTHVLLRNGSSIGFRPGGGSAYRCDYQRR